METHRLAIPYGEALACELVAVIRNHHDTMPGPERDRPGWDRVRLRLPDGREVVTDVWSSGGQDVSRAPRRVEVYDAGDLVCWRARSEISTLPDEPANDGSLRMAS